MLKHISALACYFCSSVGLPASLWGTEKQEPSSAVALTCAEREKRI